MPNGNLTKWAQSPKQGLDSFSNHFTLLHHDQINILWGHTVLQPDHFSKKLNFYLFYGSFVEIDFKTGLGYLDFPVNCKRKTHTLRTEKDIRGHLIQASHFMPNETQAADAKSLAQWFAQLASLFFKRHLIPPRKKALHIIEPQRAFYRRSYFSLEIINTNIQILLS